MLLFILCTLSAADDWAGQQVEDDRPVETSLDRAEAPSSGSLTAAETRGAGGLVSLGGGGQVETRDRLDAVTVQAVVKGGYPELLRCYDDAALTERMDLRFTLLVRPDGGVHDVRLNDMGDQDLDFATCIHRELAALSFPAPGGTEPSQIETSVWFSGRE